MELGSVPEMPEHDEGQVLKGPTLIGAFLEMINLEYRHEQREVNQVTQERAEAPTA